MPAVPLNFRRYFMKLKFVVDSLDDVDEKYHELYTEKDGKYEFTGVDGLKTQADIDRLQTALTKERADHKALKERVKIFDGRKFEDIVADLDRIPELEAAAKNGEGKNVDELVEAKIKSKLAPVERERDKLAKELQEARDNITAFEIKDKTRSIHDSIRAAIAKQTGFQAGAVEDALMYGERLFEVTEEGNVVTKDNVGVVPGISPEVWLQEMQQKKAHWWAASQGGGAAGNRGGNSYAKNPFSAEHWNLTEQGKLIRENRQKAEQMAKAAGTEIGGAKPQPKQ